MSPEAAPNIPVAKRPEDAPVLLGSLSILVEGRNGFRKKIVLLAQNEEGSEHPFYAVDPKTGKDFHLTDTRIDDGYRVLGLDVPRNPGKNVGQYYRIRVAKKRELLQKATPIETPTEH